MKGLFLVLYCLLLMVVWSQPASARGTLTVINDSKYPARVSIVYYTHLCRDDHPLVGPKSRWSVNSGLCEVKDSVVVLKDSTGKDHVCQSTRGHTLQAVWRIHVMNDPSTVPKGYTVTYTNGPGPFCGVAQA